MLGISYNFDSPAYKNNVDLSVKVVSSDHQETDVVAARISFSQREGGFYVVGYAALGYRMTTLEQWRKLGTQPIVRTEPSVPLSD